MRKVEVVPYNPDWPSMYRAEANILQTILGEVLFRIHHAGSTSVPGLHAKPIIDIVAEVRDLQKLDLLDDKMIEAGYTPKGEYGIPGRRYYFKGPRDLDLYHVHAFLAGDSEVARMLLFRDYLRAHSSEALKYAKLKQELAIRFTWDTEKYTDSKETFIREMDRKANDWANL